MFCALLGQDIRRAFTGPLILWFLLVDSFCVRRNNESKSFFWFRYIIYINSKTSQNTFFSQNTS